MIVPASLLYAVCVLIWGTTWFAITVQLAVLAPEPGVAIRFGLAAAALFAWCRYRRLPLAFDRAQHLLFAAQGLAGFCASYVCVYAAERFVVSGVVAVGYAASPLVLMVLARLFHGAAMSRRVAIGGALGLIGVALVFGHEFARLEASGRAAAGAGLTAAAVLLSGLATMAAMRYQRMGTSGWPPLAWAMAYGAAGAALAALALGRSWHWAWTGAFLATLAYLALAGSAVAFGAYFALVRRWGPARASYTGVVAPLVALAVSSLFEGFRWTPATVVGAALTAAGNVVALWPRTPQGVARSAKTGA